MGTKTTHRGDGPLLIFNDTHFHNWQEPVDPTFWRRLIQSTFLALRTAYLTHKPVATVFLGDLFESKRTIRTDILCSVLNEFGEYLQCVGPDHSIYMVAGNHDQYGASPSGSVWFSELRRLSSKIKAVEYGAVEVKEVSSNVLLVPYPHPSINRNELAALYAGYDYSIVLAHVDVTNGKYNSVAQCKESVADALFLRQDDRKYAFNAHFHVPQTVTISPNHLPVQCLGATTQFHWGDAESPRHGIHTLWPGDPPVVRSVALTGLPKFFNSPDHPDVCAGDFIRNVSLIKADAARNESHRRNHAHISKTGADSFILAYARTKEPDELIADKLAEVGYELYVGSGG